MSLRSQAEADLKTIVEDSTTGFGWPVIVTNPAGVSVPLVGLSNDIGQVVDPDTGEAVTGRLATVSLRISTLRNSVFAGIPVGIADQSIKPWLVEFTDVYGISYLFKVSSTAPDRGLGLIKCVLEFYQLTPGVVIPTNVELPAVTGGLTEGSILSLSDGVWANVPTSFVYQWYIDEVAVIGATANTYTITAGDLGGGVTGGVIASNAAGPSDEAISLARCIPKPGEVEETYTNIIQVEDATYIYTSKIFISSGLAVAERVNTSTLVLQELDGLLVQPITVPDFQALPWV